MGDLDLIIKNSTRTVILTMTCNDDSLVKDLLSAICARLELPEPGCPGRIGQLFQVEAGEVALYAPRRGLFDPEKTVRQNGITGGDTLYYSYRLSFSGTLSSIRVSDSQLLAAVSRCVVVEWQDKTYPLILPALITPQGQIEGSLLNHIVFAQIAEIEEQLISNRRLEKWRYHNTRMQGWIEAYDADTLLGDQLKHGDCLKLQPPDDNILTLDDELDDVLIIDGDQDILNQIIIN